MELQELGERHMQPGSTELWEWAAAGLSVLSSSYKIEGEFQFVLQAQGTRGNGHRLDAVIGLAEGEVAGDTQRGSDQGDVGLQRQGLRGAVERKLAIDIGPKRIGGHFL